MIIYFNFRSKNGKKITKSRENEIKDIEDIAGYRDFMRKSFDYLGMEYYTGFQKFIKLTNIYKRQYAKDTNVERISKSVQTAYILAQKVKAVISYVESGKDKYSSFSSNGKSYFTKFEISQLEKLGGLQKSVHLQKSVSGDDALFNRLKKQMQEMIIVEALPNLNVKTHPKVVKIIGKMVKKM